MNQPPTQIPDTVDGRAPDEPRLIDQFLPSCDFTVVHVGVLGAPPATCYAAARRLNLLDSPIIRVLLGIRALPQRLADRRAARERVSGSSTPTTTFGLDDMVRYGWTSSARLPTRRSCSDRSVSLEAGRAIRRASDQRGHVPRASTSRIRKIAFSLRVISHGSRSSIVTLETRSPSPTPKEGATSDATGESCPFVALIDRILR